jgi:RNA recognition motif-containing protein
MAKRERSRSNSPQNGIKLHVKNLPLNYTQEMLSQSFRPFGKVIDIKIIRKGSNGQPLRDCVYGFVAMESWESANQAMLSLNSQGWTISFSKETLQKKPVVVVEPQKELLPTDKSFYDNMQTTNMMLLNAARNHPAQPTDQALLQSFLSEHQPNALNINGVPEQFKKYFLVREVWIGNISPATDKQSLYDGFKSYGEIEGIEMFSSKGFAFIKYRKVVAATRGYEFGDGTLIDGRPVKVAFADPSRRIDIVGDSSIPENPNFNPIDDENFKNLFLGYPPGSLVPGESKLREVFSRYGKVKRISIRQATATSRPYAFVDFERGDQASEARKKLYIEDIDGSRRCELGHPALEISFKNTNNIVNKNVAKVPAKYENTSQKAEVSQIARKLMEQPPAYINLLNFQTGSVLPMVNPNLFPPSIPPPARVPVVNNPISKSEPNPSLGTVVWSGFMTRSKNYRVGIDATLVQGSEDCFPPTLYHVNISHRVQISEITKFYILGLVTIEASNETQQEIFDGYLKYFSEKQRAGYIPMKSSVLYICPPIDEIKNIYNNIKDTQLLGVFVDTQRKPEKPKDPQLQEIMELLKNPEILKHFTSMQQYFK